MEKRNTKALPIERNRFSEVGIKPLLKMPQEVLNKSTLVLLRNHYLVGETTLRCTKMFLELKDRLWAFKDTAIAAKDQKACEATGEPTIVGHSDDRSLVAIERAF